MTSGIKGRGTRTVDHLVQLFLVGTVVMIVLSPAVRAGNICADPVFAAAMGIKCTSYKPPTAAPISASAPSTTKTTSTTGTTTTPTPTITTTPSTTTTTTTTPAPTTEPETTTTTTPLPTTTPCIMSSLQWDLCQALLAPCPTDPPNAAFPSRNVSRCLANQTKIQANLTSSGIDCTSCVTTTAFTTSTPTTTTAASTTTALPGTTCTPLTSDQVVNCYFLLVDFSWCPASEDAWWDQWEYCFYQTTLVPDTADVCSCLQTANIAAGDAAFGSPPKLSEITTTGPFTYCYYTKFRPAQLTQTATLPSLRSRSVVAKRLAFPSDIGVDCQYPGIVTLFKDAGLSSQEVQGSAILLDHETILVTSFVKQTIEIAPNGQLAVHVSTYSLTSIDTFTTVTATAAAEATQLDSEETGVLFAVKLTNPLTFDTACVLPACVPSSTLDLDDLDLNDCRVVASGAFDDVDFWTNFYKTSIQEVKVTVDQTGLTSSARINVQRTDSHPTIACSNDAGGSLICPTLSTREWMTLALVDPYTFPCKTGVDLNENYFYSLLPGGTAYSNLQSYSYTAP